MKAQERYYFNSMKSPDEYENKAFVYRIEEVHKLIDENLKLYKKSLVSATTTDPSSSSSYNNTHFRNDILEEAKRLKTTLAKFEARYEDYKRRIKRSTTTIST